MRRWRIAVLYAGGLAVAPPVVAQRLELGFGAGLALPLHEFKVGSKLGVAGLATLKYRIGEGPVAVRLDAEYAEFRGKAAPTFVYPRRRIRGLSGSAEYDFYAAEPSRWRGWGFGGIGAYYDEADRGSPEIAPFGRTYLGVQFGLGGAYRMGLVSPFVELRYQAVFHPGAQVRMIPLRFGVRFGRYTSDAAY